MRRYSIHELTHKIFYTGMHRDGVRAIYWGNTIRQFAAAAVGLYVPIYIYKIGFSAFGESFVAGLRAAIIFYLLYCLSVIAFSLLVEQIINRIGFRWTLLLSSFFLAFKFILLTFAENKLSFLWIAAVVSGMVTAFYWISRHSLFGEDQDSERIGSYLGFLAALTQLTAIIGPILGGFITLLFGFAWLFRFGLVLALLSGLPFFFMHHHRRHHPDGLSGFLDKLRDPVNFPLIVGWFGRSWDSFLRTDFWPIYVFLVLGAVEKLGILTSVVAVVSMLSSYAVGKFIDRTPHRKRLFLLGAAAASFLWPVKSIARSAWSLFFVDSLEKSVNSFYWIPFMSETYRCSFRRDTVAFFVFREIVWYMGTIVFLLLAFLITFSWSWTLIFLLGGIGIVISMNLVFYRGFR